MRVYHGTDATTAHALAANPRLVDVTRGGGELGRGFYTGDSVALAIAWARGRDANGRVLEVEVDTSQYASLAVKTLNWPQVWTTWQQLFATGQTHTYLFGYDVVYGPLATNPHVGQHKFESQAAEKVLQQSAWRVL